MVGDRGFEPLTPSASRKCSPPELIAHACLKSQVPSRNLACSCNSKLGMEATAGFAPAYTVLQTVAYLLGHVAILVTSLKAQVSSLQIFLLKLEACSLELEA